MQLDKQLNELRIENQMLNDEMRKLKVEYSTKLIEFKKVDRMCSELKEDLRKSELDMEAFKHK